jgi:hypothetical protein
MTDQTGPDPQVGPRVEQDRPTPPPTAPPAPTTPAPMAPAPAEDGTLAARRDEVTRGLQMKRRHPLAAWIGLPLITLGIYHFVWYYKIHHEMGEFDPRRKVPDVGPVLVLILLGWTVIAPLISYYNTGHRIINAQRAAGLTPTCSPWIGTLLMLVAGIGILYYQIELNRVPDVYGDVPPGTEVPLRV